MLILIDLKGMNLNTFFFILSFPRGSSPHVNLTMTNTTNRKERDVKNVGWIDEGNNICQIRNLFSSKPI